MTNLQEGGGGPFLGDRFARRLVFWAPVGLGAGLSVLVLLVGVVPSLLRSAGLQESLETTQALASQLPLARGQLEEERRRNERIQQQRATLLSLIGRPGTLATFLAEVDRLAAAQQVQLDLYEPQAAPSAPAAGEASPGRAAAGEASPGRAAAGAAQASSTLQVEGLQRTTLLLSARGSYPALLRFLRALESLDVLVAQSGLSLALEPSPPAQAPPSPSPSPPSPAASPDPPAPGASASPVPARAPVVAAPGTPPRVVMKLTISLYEPAATRAAGSQLPGRP
ncbi:MAG: hypothetical protein ACKOCM_12870 [Cyanobacteriota bacterium]